MPAETMREQGKRPRVLLLTLNYRPSEKALAYGAQLAQLGVQVDLVVPDQHKLDDATIPPGVRAHPLMRREMDIPVRRVEHMLVFKAPFRILRLARRLTGRYRATRPVDAALALAERGHGKIANAFHRRLFVPFYRQVRPWLIARHALGTVHTLDPGSVDRIVAGDVSAVPLAWRLARRHRQTPATTAMELTPFAGGGTSR